MNIAKYFIGEKFHEGLQVVPLLLFANLFLGVYLNLSMWYKLSGKTKIRCLVFNYRCYHYYRVELFADTANGLYGRRMGNIYLLWNNNDLIIYLRSKTLRYSI